MNYKKLDVPITSISEVKKSPSSVFNLAEESESAVYILNRNEPVGVVLTIEQYENLVNEVEVLREKTKEK